jgi:hypothetical protein
MIKAFKTCNGVQFENTYLCLRGLPLDVSFFLATIFCRIKVVWILLLAKGMAAAHIKMRLCPPVLLLFLVIHWCVNFTLCCAALLTMIWWSHLYMFSVCFARLDRVQPTCAYSLSCLGLLSVHLVNWIQIHMIETRCHGFAMRPAHVQVASPGKHPSICNTGDMFFLSMPIF